ncbi:helitron helicase-like domain-containing protein [Aliifodinibius salicampi]|uniref:Helitron helicase-like domain-containing protein n=1 Tax=Fodinibius salicampi TaxID=1920655 RepID=A0ABT3Q052_9BACT|nr:hypothetical protein [Fodinibius salicampi]MCW9713494.1 helitron helicase-like domain-containing protein [Fodinibius salicampi]
MHNRDYRYLADAEITLIGNSCIIKENISGLSGKEKTQLKFYRHHCGKHHHFKPKNPPTREAGDITDFSRKSKLRLLKKTNRVDHENKSNPFFITLTYPEKYPEKREEYKRDLDTYFKRLKRAFGNLEYLWRLEAQKRGAPHYHLLIYFENEINIEVLKKWTSRNWFEVVQRNWDIKDLKHLKAGTNCKRIKEYRQVVYYVSKYMAKEDEERLKNQGRYWGVSTGWEDFIASDKLEGKELIWFRRLLSRYLKRKNKYMSDKVAKGGSIEIWAPKKFIIKAFLWSKLYCEENSPIS